MVDGILVDQLEGFVDSLLPPAELAGGRRGPLPLPDGLGFGLRVLLGVVGVLVSVVKVFGGGGTFFFLW